MTQKLVGLVSIPLCLAMLYLLFLVLVVQCVSVASFYCELVNGCSSGIKYCPDDGKLEFYTIWYPSPDNKGCEKAANHISFDISCGSYYSQSYSMNGPQSGNSTLTIACNTGQPYYASVTNQKNDDWDCSIVFEM